MTDAISPLLESLSGPAAGAAVVGLIWSLAHAIRRRSDASAAADQASAAGVLALIAQIEALNARCNTLEAEVSTLRTDVDSAEEKYAAEREMRLHFETLAKALTDRLELVETNARRLKAEYEASLERAQPSTKSWRPNPKR